MKVDSTISYILSKNFKLESKKCEVRDLAENEILIRNKYIYLNHFDLSLIDNTNLLAKNLPEEYVPGTHAVGEIVNVGGKVDLRAGYQVAYLAGQGGAFSEFTIVKKNQVFRLPDNADLKDIAGIFYPGIYAHSILYRTYRIQKGQYVLIHSPGNSIGEVMLQFALAVKVHPLIVTRTEDELNYVNNLGYKAVFEENDEKLAAKIFYLTENTGINVAYSFAGGKGIENINQLMAYGGVIITVGDVCSNNIPLSALERKSLNVSCPNLLDYKSNANELLISGNEVMSYYNKGKLKPVISNIYKFDKLIDAIDDFSVENVFGNYLIHV